MPHPRVLAYRLAVVGALLALAVLSLMPAGTVPRTELGGHGEHVFAYLGTAFLLGIGARRRMHVPLLLALVSYAGLLEILQGWAPGRTSQAEDFVYSAVGVLLGTLVAWRMQSALRRRERQPPLVRARVGEA